MTKQSSAVRKEDITATPGASAAVTLQVVKSVEPVYEIDVVGINAEISRLFKEALSSRLIGSMNGQPHVTTPTVFKVSYRPVSGGPDIEQYWTAYMGEGYPEVFSAYDMLVPDSNAPALKSLSDAFEAFKNVELSTLHLLPICAQQVSPVMPMYAQVRGHKNDKTPFIIHSKQVGRIYSCITDKKFSFTSIDSEPLSENTQKILSRWFGAQLAEVVTAEFASNVFADAAAAFLFRSINVQGLRKQLDSIEEMGKNILNYL